MSESSNDDAIQFDKAEYETAPEQQCFACAEPLQTSYYEVNGLTSCPSCKDQIESSRVGGSWLGRLIKAFIFGILGAIVGASIYYGVVFFTGYEVGLISILVGYIVGKSVFFGSESRGGGGYQLLAILLTYMAIVSTYVPIFYQVLDMQGLNQTATLEAEFPVLPGAEETLIAESVPEQALTTDAPVLEAAAPTFAEFAVLIVVLLALPFLAGFDNIIGLLIIAFGLYQAWATTKKVNWKITGPFQIAAEKLTA